jgi:hypothetical protein
VRAGAVSGVLELKRPRFSDAPMRGAAENLGRFRMNGKGHWVFFAGAGSLLSCDWGTGESADGFAPWLVLAGERCAGVGCQLDEERKVVVLATVSERKVWIQGRGCGIG